MAEGARLESVYTETYRGFESLPHRHILEERRPRASFFICESQSYLSGFPLTAAGAYFIVNVLVSVPLKQCASINRRAKASDVPSTLTTNLPNKTYTTSQLSVIPMSFCSEPYCGSVDR